MPTEKPINTLTTTHIIVRYSSIEECELYLKHPCEKISELVSRWTKDINKAHCFGDIDTAFYACDLFEGTGVRRIQI